LANLNGTIIGDLVLPVPPRTEQATITAFLDRETAKIDALIAAQQRLIELLQEKRQAVIAHAVTKGLNPDVPMKDSGIEWLGEVPEHWKVASLRYFATFSSGATPDRANMNFWTGGIPWVKTGEINYGPIAATEEEISQEGLESSSCSIAPKGTLLMALYGQGATRGRVAILGLDAAFNQACVAITTDHRLLTQFLWSYFVFAYAFIRGIGNENTQMNMNVDYVRGFRVPLPPLDEQRAIAAHVNNESHRFEELCAEADRAITLLQERRSAVISAAVTGQIDVRGLAETSEAA
jgi:type I restriction enzyme S subunit